MQRSWYWVARLVDPRELNPDLAGMFISLEFMPSSLCLETSPATYFRTVASVPSNCVVVGGASGTDSISLAETAMHRIEDAVRSLSLATHQTYQWSLVGYSLDAVPGDFAPGEEKYLKPRFGRCPPMTREVAQNVRLWYQALQHARPLRNALPKYAAAVDRAYEALLHDSPQRGVLVYAALEELCQFFGGMQSSQLPLSFGREERQLIERARRPYAHGGRRGVLQPHEYDTNVLARAACAFAAIFRMFLLAQLPDASVTAEQ